MFLVLFSLVLVNPNKLTLIELSLLFKEFMDILGFKMNELLSIHISLKIIYSIMNYQYWSDELVSDNGNWRHNPKKGIKSLAGFQSWVFLRLWSPQIQYCKWMTAYAEAFQWGIKSLLVFGILVPSVPDLR